MMSEVQELLADHQPCHSDFQIDHFIIGSAGPTAYGMYRQALRELYSRLQALRSKDPHEIHPDRMRELLRFYAIARALKRELGDLTPERRAELDAEMWRQNIKGIVATEMLVQRCLSKSTVEMILSTPRAWRNDLLSQIAGGSGADWLAILDGIEPYKLDVDAEIAALGEPEAMAMLESAIQKKPEKVLTQ